MLIDARQIPMAMQKKKKLIVRPQAQYVTVRTVEYADAPRTLATMLWAMEQLRGPVLRIRGVTVMGAAKVKVFIVKWLYDYFNQISFNHYHSYFAYLVFCAIVSS